MRGAPQVGFSAAMRKIKARTSWLTGRRPPLWRALESHFQYSRKPARCQLTTLLGVTSMRGSFHRVQRLRNTTQNSLCHAVSRRRGRWLCKSEELLTQGEVFQDEILAGTKGTAKPAEDVPEPYDHAKNLTGTLPIELGANSLILWVYDVLMSHRRLSFCFQEALAGLSKRIRLALQPS